MKGQTKSWMEKDVERHFCPSCGSTLFSVGPGEIEMRIGVFDEAPTDLTPTYELWVGRREKWIRMEGDMRQFSGNRT